MNKQTKLGLALGNFNTILVQTTFCCSRSTIQFTCITFSRF